MIMSDDTPDMDRTYPNVAAWMARLCEFPVARKVLAERAAALATVVGGGD